MSQTQKRFLIEHSLKIYYQHFAQKIKATRKKRKFGFLWEEK